MHIFKEINKNLHLQWGLSLLIVIINFFIPGNPYSFSILIPIFLCKVFPRKKVLITLFYSLIWGVYFCKNFFVLHGWYSVDSLNPLVIVLGENYSESLNINSFFNLYLLLGLISYVCIFFLIFYIIKKLFKKYDFYSSIALVLIMFGIIWLVLRILVFKNAFALILGLSLVMLSHHVFYIFNYIRFFKCLPKNRTQWLALFQPFWFLTSEIPENPIMKEQSTHEENQRNTRESLNILFSSLIFKLFVIITMTAFCFFKTNVFTVMTSEIDMFYKFFYPIFLNWRNESAITLIITIFIYSFTYLISTFFVYGRFMIGIARLCGFILPDYIDKPWRSTSFSDFFSRTMYYYNIIIINLFFYPALDYSRKFSLQRKTRIFICLNWALVFGGFFARVMKDIHQFFLLGFEGAFIKIFETTIPYLIVLASTITLTMLFQKKHKVESTNIARMFLYIFIYGLINILNFSRVFGGLNGTIGLYIKIFSMGLIKY